MTTSRDLEHVLDSYLEDGPTELPDRSYDDVRTSIDHIQQRAVIGLWRTPQMPTVVRVAAIGVVVFAFTLAGFSLAPRQSGIGGEVSPSPTITPHVMTQTGDFVLMAPGTYVTGAPFLTRVTFTLPATPDGWEGRLGAAYGAFLGTPSADLLGFEIFNDVYANPCEANAVLMSPAPGPSVDELASALASQPGLLDTPPTDVTLGGYQGKQLTLAAPATGGTCRAWQLMMGGDDELTPGEMQRVWILDVAGQRLVIEATEPPDLSAQTKAAVQAVLDSIQIQPVGSATEASPAPTTSTSGEPTASPMALPAQDTAVSVPLEAGTYFIDDSRFTNTQRFSLTVPAGWSTHEGFVVKNEHQPTEVMLATWTLTDIFSDACQWGTLVPVGTTVDELMNALVKQGGRTASAPTSVSIDGFPAMHTVMTVPADLDVTTCTNGNLRFWPDPGPDLSGGLCCDLPGNIDVVYGVDVNGRRLVIVARHYPGTSDADNAELQGILGSIKIVPLPDTASPVPVGSAESTASPASPSPAGS